MNIVFEYAQAFECLNHLHKISFMNIVDLICYGNNKRNKTSVY